jgi:hypothetical protein
MSDSHYASWIQVFDKLRAHRPEFLKSAPSGIECALNEIGRLQALDRQQSELRGARERLSDELAEALRHSNSWENSWENSYQRVLNERNVLVDRSNALAVENDMLRKSLAEATRVKDPPPAIVSGNCALHRANVSAAVKSYARNKAAGLGIYYPFSVAKAVLYLLERVEKLEKAAEDNKKADTGAKPTVYGGMARDAYGPNAFNDPSKRPLVYRHPDSDLWDRP